MINCEIKKTYLINLIIGMIFLIAAIAFTIILLVLKVYVALIAVLVIFIVAGYFVIRYFRYKKQYLKFDENGFEGKVVSVKGSKPMVIKGNLSFIIGASSKGSVLILTNERGENLNVYNIVNAKQAAEEINKLLKK